MTTLEIILIAIIWIAYGTFNAYQHNWHKYDEEYYILVFLNILCAPIAFCIRLFRGIFYYKLPYK